VGTLDIQRADIALTAVVFSGHIKGELRFRFGPWVNPKARMDDLTDLQKMGANSIPLRPLSGPDRYF
jgi:hypothetical protein